MHRRHANRDTPEILLKILKNPQAETRAKNVHRLKKKKIQDKAIHVLKMCREVQNLKCEVIVISFLSEQFKTFLTYPLCKQFTIPQTLHSHFVFRRTELSDGFHNLATINEIFFPYL